MFKIEELSGSLIRSGKFRDAIPVVHNELFAALDAGVVTQAEMRALLEIFSLILLNPAMVGLVEQLSERMLKLALRIPGYVKQCSPEEFEKNVKASREAK